MKEIIQTIEENKMLLEVSKEVYENDAILNASYKFTDNCKIHIDPINDEKVGVYFTKKENTKDSLKEIALDFCNELIDQQLRLNTERDYKVIREEIVKKAFLPVNKK